MNYFFDFFETLDSYGLSLGLPLAIFLAIPMFMYYFLSRYRAIKNGDEFVGTIVDAQVIDVVIDFYWKYHYTKAGDTGVDYYTRINRFVYKFKYVINNQELISNYKEEVEVPSGMVGTYWVEDYGLYCKQGDTIQIVVDNKDSRHIAIYKEG